MFKPEITDIFIADKSNNDEIIRILKKYPVSSSSLSYKVDRSPDYFAFSELQGVDYKILIAKKDDVLQGYMSIIFDKVYLENKETLIAYTGELRVEEFARRTGVADRLMEEAIFTIERYKKNTPVFTCVASDNKAGLKKNMNLTKKNITEMKQTGEIITYFFLPYDFRFKYSNNKKYEIRKSTENDLKEMYELWKNINSKRNLSRVYDDFESFKTWVSKTPGLSPDSFILAIENNQIKGFLGIWNQFELRRIIIDSESLSMKLIRNIINNLNFFTGFPHFPSPGENLNFYNVVNTCISPDKTEIFPLLLSYAFKEVKNNNSLFLALALDKKDELNNLLKDFFAIKSEILLLSNYNDINENKKDFHLEISFA